MLDDTEMIEILEDIARSGKSHGARIEAIKQLRAIREQGAPEEKKPEEKTDAFDGLYEVENPGRVRRAS